jgi:hypothetical protein
VARSTSIALKPDAPASDRAAIDRRGDAHEQPERDEVLGLERPIDALANGGRGDQMWPAACVRLEVPREHRRTRLSFARSPASRRRLFAPSAQCHTLNGLRATGGGYSRALLVASRHRARGDGSSRPGSGRRWSNPTRVSGSPLRRPPSMTSAAAIRAIKSPRPLTGPLRRWPGGTQPVWPNATRNR